MFKKINFAKMHGLGNDFVIINQRDLPINCDLQQLSLNISNRRTGIGCDQFIIYDQKANYYEMAVYNQNGSSAKLCGNASRCLTKLLYLDFGITEVTLRIYGKELSCKILSDNEIEVNTGIVSFEEDWMPSAEKIWPIMERYMIDIKEVICADIGNPHFIIFSDLATKDKEIIGEKLQAKELFTDGVNVNFATGEAIIIAADTVVARGRKILPKALTSEDVRYCLNILSGRRHRVYTGVCIIKKTFEQLLTRQKIVQTIVKFKKLSHQEIEFYCSLDEGINKAGGCMIHGYAEAFIPSIYGSYSNIMGLPLLETMHMLTSLGFKNNSM